KIATMGRLKISNEFSVLLASRADTPVIVLDAGMRVVSVNDAFRRLGTQPPQEGQWIYEAQAGAWNTAELHALLELDLPREIIIRNRHAQIDFPGLGRRSVKIDGYHVCGDNGPVICGFLAFTLEPQVT
ncbi:MAG TPA: hypothetical protein VL359_14190, partial [bacterium]|nr:hypothetical protein [bacterium]